VLRDGLRWVIEELMEADLRAQLGAAAEPSNLLRLLEHHTHVHGRVTEDAPLVDAGPPPPALVARRPG
ncbi:MAG: hypothetical protein MUQ32_09790, partial [Chloroflexi bacterium]|nr:hypothetical protein [Chloroflexota bacterium]